LNRVVKVRTYYRIFKYLQVDKNNGNSISILRSLITEVCKYGDDHTLKYYCSIFYKRFSNGVKRIFKKYLKILNKNTVLKDDEQIQVSKKHYSLSGQDIFVSSLLRSSTAANYYVEVGAGWPIKINNTYLLESVYNWSGISIDFDREMSNNFNETRINKCLFADATKIDYLNLFISENLPLELDYLSLDIDPAYQTLLVLSLIPFETYRFKVITFEHDAYKNGSLIKIASRLLLRHYGYVNVSKNVIAAGFGKYEDWWINPRYISIQEGKSMAKKVREQVK
jgi:hypothetical protein